MHIVQIVPHYLPASRFGGPQHVAHGLGKALVEAGHRVSVCTTNLQDEHTDLTVPVNQPVDCDGVTVYYSPVCLSRYWGYSPDLRRCANRLIPTADAVLVHAHYQYANWIGARIARRHRKPHVVFAHGSLRDAAISERGRFRKALYLTLMERANLRDAALLVFNADEEREGSSRYAKRGIVIPNGLDPRDFQEMPTRGGFRGKCGVPEDATLLLYLGRLDVERKGLDLLLPAFAQAARRDPSLHLVIAGPDERQGLEVLKTVIAQRKIGERVHIVGLLTGQDKLAALVDSDAFVLTSRSEGLSIALLEALYVGLPVLVSDQVGLHRTIGQWNAGIVVRPTVEQITGGLIELTRPGALQGMRGKARHWIESFHLWPGIADELLRALDPMLRRGSPVGQVPSLSEGNVG